MYRYAGTIDFRRRFFFLRVSIMGINTTHNIHKNIHAIGDSIIFSHVDAIFGDFTKGCCCRFCICNCGCGGSGG
jgi:hypothetical protein